MEYGQTAQDGAALPRQGDQHPASVQWVRVALDQSARLHAVDQANGAVVANLQPIRQVGDGSSAAWSQAAQHEQQLVVLWFEAGRFGRVLAEGEIPPDESPSQGEVGVILRAQIRGGSFPTYRNTICRMRTTPMTTFSS